MTGDWQWAADLWAGLGCPYESAVALADADDDEALRRSLELFQELGARPAAARSRGQAAAEAARLGIAGGT